MNIINAFNTAEKHSSKKNLLLNIILGVVFRQQKQHDISSARMKERLMMAVEKLHHQTVDQRLEGVLELEKLANLSCKYNWEIIEILTAFVRKNAPLKMHEPAEAIPVFKIYPDIQAALSVISTKDRQHYSESEQIDLSYTDLSGANLNEANLAGANLYHANLSGVNLAGANLTGAILSAANLSRANLAGANLANAIISAANLSQANLAKANLLRANFYLANLYQANLQNAILDGANLREAKLSGQETINAE